MLGTASPLQEFFFFFDVLELQIFRKASKMIYFLKKKKAGNAKTLMKEPCLLSLVMDYL